jgi:hypothetical protein
VGAWLADQVRAGRVSGQTLAVAVDGKSLRGAVQDDGARCICSPRWSTKKVS